MLLIASVVPIAAVLFVLGANIAVSPDLRFGYEQLIHARTPWLLLGALATGVALGLVAVVRRPAVHRVGVVAVELALAGLLGWYFLAFSYLPAHPLAVAVGDAFPVYALPDQDGLIRRVEASPERSAALYIFYRGDW